MVFANLASVYHFFISLLHTTFVGIGSVIVIIAFSPFIPEMIPENPSFVTTFLPWKSEYKGFLVGSIIAFSFGSGSLIVLANVILSSVDN